MNQSVQGGSGGGTKVTQVLVKPIIPLATPVLFIAWALSPSISWAWVIVSVLLDARAWRAVGFISEAVEARDDAAQKVES